MENEINKTSNQFKYYNHSLIPALDENEVPDLTDVLNGKIWKTHKDGNRSFFLTYTTNFDCGFETDWWYAILDKKQQTVDLSSRQRYLLKTTLKQCYCKKITAKEYYAKMEYIAQKASENYKKFKKSEYNYKNLTNDIIGCFKNDELIAFVILEKRKILYTSVVKINPKFRTNTLRPSLALNWFIQENYINTGEYQIVSNGSRNIVHVTNYDDFLISRLNFRKAYCYLHFIVNPKYKILFYILYLFRFIFILFDANHFIHKINSAFRMYKISKKCKKIFEHK